MIFNSLSEKEVKVQAQSPEGLYLLNRKTCTFNAEADDLVIGINVIQILKGSDAFVDEPLRTVSLYALRISVGLLALLGETTTSTSVRGKVCWDKG
jgi:hypothetical protein